MAEKLKKGCIHVAFGDVVRQVRDCVDPEKTDLKRYIAGEHMNTDDLRIRRWGLIGDGYLGPAFHMRFKPGHVLYGSRRTYLRKVAIADFEGITANTTFVLESKDPKILLPELLPFIMQTESFHQHSIKQSKGSVNPYINFSDLTWYELSLPPLEKQRRIVKVLNTITMAVESLKMATDRAKDIHLSIMDRHFRQNLNSKHKEQLLCDLTTRVNDGTHLPPTFVSSGVPFLLVSNIASGRIDWSVDKHVSSEVFEQLSRSWRPQKDDVLYSLVGSYGVPAMVDQDIPFTFQRHIGLIRSNPSKLLPKFLYWYLRSPNGIQQAHLRAEGLAQKTITLGALRAFRIPVPSLERQCEIASENDTIEKGIITIENPIYALDQLTKSFVAINFGGDV